MMSFSIRYYQILTPKLNTNGSEVYLYPTYNPIDVYSLSIICNWRQILITTIWEMFTIVCPFPGNRADMWNPWIRSALLCLTCLPKSTNAVDNFHNFSWISFSSSVLQQSMNNSGTKVSKDINVYYAIFAGRKDVMHIHFQYTDIMLQLGLVTEVHVWDFTNGNTADYDHLTSFIRDTTLHGYRLFEKPSTQTDWLTQSADKYLWYSFYHHFLNNKKYTVIPTTRCVHQGRRWHRLYTHELIPSLRGKSVELKRQ